MSINTKVDDISKNDILHVAQLCSIKNATQIIDEVNAAISKWKKFSNAAGVEAEQQSVIQKQFVKIK